MIRIVSLATLLVVSAPAIAFTDNCASREVVLTRLAQSYGEARQTIALSAGNQVVETFANIESGSWSIVVTQPDGLACLVASGKGFELVTGEAERKPGIDG